MKDRTGFLDGQEMADAKNCVGFGVEGVSAPRRPAKKLPTTSLKSDKSILLALEFRFEMV